MQADSDPPGDMGKEKEMKMKGKKAAAFLTSALTAALLLASCGSSGAGMSSAAAEKADTGYSGGYSSPAVAAGNAAAEEAAEEDWASEEAMDVVDIEDGDSLAYAAADDAGGAETADGEDGEYKNLEKIVYTCSADIQTLEYDQSVKDLKAAVKSAGGIIEQETESDDNYSWYYYDSSDSSGSNNRTLYLTVRIPTEKYESFVNSLGDYGKVMNKTQTADNISKTYNDKKTYISSLETEQKRLLEMMDKAETIEDMMAVEERLTEVQRQLNQYKTDLEAMDMDIAYSTVNLNMREVQKITNQPTPKDSFGTRIKKAFINAWEGFAEFCENFLFALIYLLPAIIVIGLIVWAVLFATRKRRKAKREKKLAEKEMIEDLKRRAREEREKQEQS